MKKRMMCILFLMLLTMALTVPFLNSQAASNNLSVTAQVDTYSIETEQMVRPGWSACGEGEFISLVYILKNNGTTDLYAKSAYTRIDGGDKLGWGSISLGAGKSLRMHVYYVNMAKLAAGNHKCVLYLNDKAVATMMVNIPRSWNGLFTLPSQSQISATNRAAKARSPYIGGWLQANVNQYIEYAIDMKADYLPNGTYVCSANWYMNYSSLLKQYAKVDNGGHISGYGGLQKWDDGTTHSIMSMWDVYCKDKKGNVVKTIQPTQIYPSPGRNPLRFTGEGIGAHVLPDFKFEAGKWYRMLYTCTTSPDTGNTVVTQYVIDLDTKKKTKLAAFDTGVKNACFGGNIAIFLENHHKEYSGEIRTAEFKNARIKLKDGTWKNVNKMIVHQSYDHPGSYRYGSDGQQFWMITTGVGNDRQNETTLTVKNQESGRPY